MFTILTDEEKLNNYVGSTKKKLCDLHQIITEFEYYKNLKYTEKRKYTKKYVIKTIEEWGGKFDKKSNSFINIIAGSKEEDNDINETKYPNNI